MAVSDGFHVDLAALTLAARGIDGVVQQVAARDVGAVDGVDVGHARLASAVGSFCDRWASGVGNLAHDAQETSARLDGCLAAYRTADTAVHDQFFSGSGPDPGAR